MNRTIISLEEGEVPTDSSTSAHTAQKGIQGVSVAEESPPNGGFYAWLQVLCTFCVFLNTWYAHQLSLSHVKFVYNSKHRGVVNMFGVFETYYVSSLITEESKSNVAWIGSLQGFLLLITGVVSGPLYDAGYLRPLLYIGTTCIVAGMMLTSACKAYWQLLLAQGILMGLGNGLLFVTSISHLPQYFTTKKSFTTGLASLGSSIGR